MDRRARAELFKQLRWTHRRGGELMIESPLMHLLHN